MGWASQLLQLSLSQAGVSPNREPEFAAQPRTEPRHSDVGVSAPLQSLNHWTKHLPPKVSCIPKASTTSAQARMCAAALPLLKERSEETWSFPQPSPWFPFLIAEAPFVPLLGERTWKIYISPRALSIQWNCFKTEDSDFLFLLLRSDPGQGFYTHLTLPHLLRCWPCRVPELVINTAWICTCLLRYPHPSALYLLGDGELELLYSCSLCPLLFIFVC